jgi:hypothetical protein
MTIRTSLTFGAACVTVASDDPDAARWLAEFVAPWFESGPAMEAALEVRFTASPAEFETVERRAAATASRLLPCFALDHGVVVLPGSTDGEAVVIADAELDSFYRVSEGRVDVFGRPGCPRARIGLMRVVRELLVTAAQRASPHLDLHAAAFASPAGAVLLVGPKQTGKTTLLVHMLRTAGAALVANDRVIVDVEPTPPLASGVPTLVSVRDPTLALFPDLRHAPDERPALRHRDEVPVYSAAAAPATGPAKNFSLSPAQLASRCGSATTRCAPIAAIVFPAIDPSAVGWSLHPVPAHSGSTLLLASRYGVGAPHRAPTIFAELGGDSLCSAGQGMAQVARLSAGVPLFRCRLGNGAYRDSADALLRALIGVPTCVEPAS